MVDVAVVIPTRNRPVSVRRALQSVSVSIKTIIVIDDCSDPCLAEKAPGIFQSDRSTKWFHNTERHGAGYCRNMGARKAKENWLLFLDDDDQLLEGYFEAMQELFSLHPDIQAWVPDVLGRKKRKFGVVAVSDVRTRNIVGGCSGLLICKSLFKEVGGFDEDFSSMQDWDLWIRLVQRRALYYSGISGVVYDPNSEEKITHNLAAKYQGLRRLYFKYRSFWDLKAQKWHLNRLRVLRHLRAGRTGICKNCVALGFMLGSLYYVYHWRRFI